MAFLDYEDWIYEVNEKEHGITIIYYNGNSINVTIPSSIDNLKVTKIGSGISPIFFSNGQGNVQSIVIPDSVNEIADCAFFMCNALRSVLLPLNLVIIGRQAFSSCTSLLDVTFTEGLEVIDQNAFFDCVSLTAITIPSTIKRISSRSFFNCVKLENVIIQDGVECIGSFAFRDTKLKHLELPASIVEVSYDAFDDDVTITGHYAPEYISKKNATRIEKESWEIKNNYKTIDTSSLYELVEGILKENSEITDLSITYGQQNGLDNKTVDLSPLSKMTLLKKLSIKDSAFEIAYLEQDKSELPMYVNFLSISSLANLVNLYYLDLSATPVQDLNPISTLINLQKLNLSFTSIVNIDALLPLVNLNDLDLSLCYLLNKIEPSFFNSFIKLKKLSIPFELENWNQVNKALLKLGFKSGSYRNVYVK